jgi:hypothetical protein
MKQIQYLTTVYITTPKELLEAITRYQGNVVEYVDTPLAGEWAIRVYRKVDW